MRVGHTSTATSKTLFFGAILFASASSAWAQDVETMDQATSGNVGVHGGLVKVRDADDGDFQGGVHLELTPARWFGIQAAVDYRSREQFAFQAGALQADAEVRTLPVMVSGKVYIPVAQFAPYALGGAGWYHQKLDFSPDLEALGFADRTDTNFGWHLGAGAAVHVSPRVSLFGEGRWVFLDPDRALNDSTGDQIEDFDFNSSHLLAGVNFHF